MAKDGPDIKIDEKSIAMFTRYMQEQAKPTGVCKGIKVLAEEFGVTQRTFERKIALVQKAIDDLNTIASAGKKITPPPEPEIPKEEKPPKPAKVPGKLSQEVAMRQQFQGDLSLTEQDREAYHAIVMPERNPLDGLSDGQISQAGVAVGVVFGGGLAKMGRALSDVDRPLGERAMMMTQGSAAVANTLLGVYESLRVWGIFEPEGLQKRNMKVIDGDRIGPK
jgi:hypothetical protein